MRKEVYGNMELRVLRYFLVVAQEENITRAAAQLHISQPSLSRQLMQMEEELGVRLFRRSNHSIVLTEEGRLLRRRAQEIVSLTEKTKRELVQKETLEGVISIGSGELRNTAWLSERMVSFQKENPLVRYEFFSGNSDEIKERIEQGNLDFGLLLEPVDIGKYHFIRTPVQEEWCAFVPKGHELAGKTAVTREDLKDLPLIFSKRPQVQSEITHWFGGYAEQLKVVANGNLPYNMAVLARKGAGIFLSIHLECDYQGLVPVKFSPALQTGAVMVWKKAQSFSRVSEEFIKYIKKLENKISDDSI